MGLKDELIKDDIDYESGKILEEFKAIWKEKKNKKFKEIADGIIDYYKDNFKLKTSICKNQTFSDDDVIYFELINNGSISIRVDFGFNNVDELDYEQFAKKEITINFNKDGYPSNQFKIRFAQDDKIPSKNEIINDELKQKFIDSSVYYKFIKVISEKKDINPFSDEFEDKSKYDNLSDLLKEIDDKVEFKYNKN